MTHVPPPPLGSHPAQHAAAPSQRTVVEVVARRGGIGQALLFLATLAFVATAFLAGLVFGAVAALAPQGGQGLPLESELRAGAAEERIAVIAVEGAIDEATSDEVTRAVRHVLATPSFRAVVLRVDSPGGAVSPSDRIWKEIESLKTAGIPVVASYGGIAASGGVYVSCGADAIVCEPTATTGSVGVIASVLTFGDLMEKVGVTPETLVASGSPRKSEANDIYRTWNQQDRAVVQSMLDRSYETFVSRVVQGRTGKAADMTLLRSALDGRVVGADEAQRLGLVDTIGYLEDAIAEAERRAGIATDAASVVRLFEPAPFFGGGPFLSLRSLLDGTIDASRAHPVDSAERAGALPLPQADAIRDLLQELGTPRLEYRLHL